MIGNYYCVDCTCGATGKARDFTGEIESREEIVYCPNNEKTPLKLMGTKTFMGINNGTFKKGRSAKEKAERRRISWHRDTTPYIALDKQEKAHFNKKFGKPL